MIPGGHIVRRADRGKRLNRYYHTTPLAIRDKPDHDDAVSHLQTIIAEYKLR